MIYFFNVFNILLHHGHEVHFIRFMQQENNAIELLLAIQTTNPNALIRFKEQYTRIQDQAARLLKILPPSLKKQMGAIHREITGFAKGEHSLFVAVEQMGKLCHQVDISLVENTFITNAITTVTNTMLNKVQTRITGEMDTLANHSNFYEVLLFVLSMMCIMLALVILGYLRRSVVARLISLGDETLRLADKSNVIAGRQILVKGQDEVATLAQYVNSLLDEIALR